MAKIELRKFEYDWRGELWVEPSLAEVFEWLKAHGITSSEAVVAVVPAEVLAAELRESGYRVIGPDGPDYEAAYGYARHVTHWPYLSSRAPDEGVVAIDKADLFAAVDAALDRTNEDGASGSMSRDIDSGGAE